MARLTGTNRKPQEWQSFARKCNSLKYVASGSHLKQWIVFSELRVRVCMNSCPPWHSWVWALWGILTRSLKTWKDLLGISSGMRFIMHSLVSIPFVAKRFAQYFIDSRELPNYLILNRTRRVQLHRSLKYANITLATVFQTSHLFVTDLLRNAKEGNTCSTFHRTGSKTNICKIGPMWHHKGTVSPPRLVTSAPAGCSFRSREPCWLFFPCFFSPESFSWTSSRNVITRYHWKVDQRVGLSFNHFKICVFRPPQRWIKCPYSESFFFVPFVFFGSLQMCGRSRIVRFLGEAVNGGIKIILWRFERAFFDI